MKTNKYKKITIKSLLNSLEEIMTQNSQLTLESEVIISDLNMSFFKHDIRVLPIHDYTDGQLKVGLYLNPYEKEEITDIEETDEERTNKNNVISMADFIKKVTKQETPKETKTSNSTDWLEKYLRR